ncbi:MAG: hypothetical protein KDA89_08785 [Planctomycetaceae bacterium]|nr:hypothetical protein [Planctomycetaceae bacterium]
MKWLYPIGQFGDLAGKYFRYHPQEPLGHGRSTTCMEHESVINGNACLLYRLWEKVYKGSQKTAPDVVIWVEDIGTLMIPFGSNGLRLNKQDSEQLDGMLREQGTEENRISNVTGYSGMDTQNRDDRKATKELLEFFSQIQSRGINHLAFRGLTNPSSFSRLHLLAIARLFNARTVSIPTLPCLFRKYQVKKGDKMSKLHSLLDDQVFYGTPPAEIVLGTGSDLFYNSKERSDADVATFYRNYFRFGSPPLSTVGSEVVLYGLVRDAQRCDFVFPGTPQYRNCLTTVNNEKYMPPAVAEKKRRRICERIRERHAKRVARRQAR